MGRALWIAGAVIFTSLLLYLGYVGHREMVNRYAATVPVALNKLGNVMLGYSQLAKKPGVADVILAPSPPAKKPDIAETAVAPSPPAQKPGIAETVVAPSPPAQQSGIAETVVAPSPPAQQSGIAETVVAPSPPVTSPVAMVPANIELLRVKYDERGELVLAGKATPGVVLEFTIDGKHLNRQTVRHSGVWQLSVPRNVSPGQHRLHIVSPALADQPRVVVVLPFIKAGADEIAAMAAFEAVKVLQHSKKIAKMVVPVGKNIVLPDVIKVPKVKNMPDRSKLAKLARVQNVLTDVTPLAGISSGLSLDSERAPSRVETSGNYETLSPKQPQPLVPETGVKTQAVPTTSSIDNAARVKANPIGVVPSSAIQSTKLRKTTPVKTTEITKLVEDAEQPEPDFVVMEPKKASDGSTETNYAIVNIYGRKVTVPLKRGVFVVQPGNTLWDLAISIYGSGYSYSKLLRANRKTIRNPRMIFPGQIIFAPDANPPLSIKPASPPQWTPPGKN